MCSSTLLFLMSIQYSSASLLRNKDNGNTNKDESNKEGADESNTNGDKSSTNKVENTTTTTTKPKPTRRLGRHYDPNWGYEPYWPGGQWVLYGDPNAPSTQAPPEICGDECHYLYQEVGKVCGRSIDDRTKPVKVKDEGDKHDSECTWWDYGHCHETYYVGYKTFDSYCEFLDKACKSANDTKPAFPRFIFVHMGPCLEDHTIYYKPVYKAEQPVSRMEFYLRSVADTFYNLGRSPF